MTTKRHLVVLTLAALLGAPMAASAQAIPPTPPTPRIAPVPMPVVIPDLQPILALQDLRVLDDLKLKFEDMKIVMDDARFELQNQDNLFRYSTGLRGQGDYSSGKDLLNQRKYEEAISRFDRVVAQKAANVDGALYWKAYAQFKLGKTEEALATIATLRKDHAQSRYLPDAKALEADARRMAGQPVNPAAMNDDDLKLLAINGIKNTDPERAIPLLENVLSSTNSLRVKKQALYVLATMSGQPRARQILISYAKGGGNPDLQLEAIRYIAANADKQVTAADLMQIYQSTQDTDVKLAVISALRASDNRVLLNTIVSSSGSPVVVRSSALSGLAGAIGPQELLALYEKETNKDLRLQIVGILGSMEATDQLTRVIRTDKDPEVVRRAIRSLGNQPAAKTGQLLVDTYTREQDPDTRKTVISALAAQNNAEGLVAIAGKEASLPLKTDIVRRLAEMAPKSKVAADYLASIIK